MVLQYCEHIQIFNYLDPAPKVTATHCASVIISTIPFTKTKLYNTNKIYITQRNINKITDFNEKHEG